MSFGLKEQVVEQIVSVFRENQLVDEVVLYGSRAKGCSKPGSDIDFAIKGDQLDLKELNRISLALDDLLLPYTFDLSIYRHISNSDLLEHIERVGIIFYKKNKSLSVHSSACPP